MSNLGKPLSAITFLVLGMACRPSAAPAGPQPAALKLKVGSAELALLTPRTPADEARGLMGVEVIPDAGGMLFDERDKAEHPVASMWMKNCPIAMDMVFCAPDGRVQKILTARAEPKLKQDEAYPEYTPLGELTYANLVSAVRSHSVPTCDWVFELRAGRAKELGLIEGQVLDQLPRLAWVPVRAVLPDRVPALGLRLPGAPQGDEMGQAQVRRELEGGR